MTYTDRSCADVISRCVVCYRPVAICYFTMYVTYGSCSTRTVTTYTFYTISMNSSEQIAKRKLHIQNECIGILLFLFFFSLFFFFLFSSFFSFYHRADVWWFLSPVLWPCDLLSYPEFTNYTYTSFLFRTYHETSLKSPTGGKTQFDTLLLIDLKYWHLTKSFDMRTNFMFQNLGICLMLETGQNYQLHVDSHVQNVNICGPRWYKKLFL